MFYIAFLLFVAVVVDGAAKFSGANQTVIKMEKSRQDGLICNDEKTRFALNITLSKNTTSYDKSTYRLKFCHEHGGVQMCQPNYIPLVDFDSSMPYYYFKFIVNPYYNYRFKLFELEQELEGESETCEDLYDMNRRFGQCDQYTLHIDESKCTLLLVKPTPTSKGYIKYFYIGTMVLLGLFVLFKSIQVFFFRYKLLNN